MIECLPVKRCSHNLFQFFSSEIFLYSLWTYRFVSCKRIIGNDSVCYGFAYNCLQLDGQVDDCSGSKVTLCPKIQIVFVDEETVQCRERYVRQLILCFQKLRQMVIRVFICPQTFFRTIYAYTFLKITDKLSEIAQECFLPASHPKQLVFHFFG